MLAVHLPRPANAGSPSPQCVDVFGHPGARPRCPMSAIGTRGTELVLPASAIVAALVGALLAGGGVWVFPICAVGFELVEDHRKGLELLATPVLLVTMPMTPAVLLWVGTTILFALPVALSAEAPRSRAPPPTQEAQSLLGAADIRTHLAVLGVSTAATG